MTHVIYLNLHDGVHTIKFQRVLYGSSPSELKIEETDVSGFTRHKTLEHHFYWIFNHGDYNATPWQNSQYMANYTSKWTPKGKPFPTTPSTTWDQHRHGTISNYGMNHRKQQILHPIPRVMKAPLFQ